MEEPRLRIIVVDDEEPIRAILGEFFVELGGFEVETAGDGLEALEKIKRSRFDCAFLDLQMPRMTGIELLHYIKDYDNTLPVIIMTGYPSLDAAIDTMRHGASDFLTKPVRLSQLKLVVERVLKERRLLVENLRLKDQLKQKEAIERLNAELQRKVREQTLLYSVAETVNNVRGAAGLYSQMASLACSLVSSKLAMFLLFDQDTNVLYSLASHGLAGDLAAQEFVVNLGQGLVGRSAEVGQPIICNSPDAPVEVVSTTDGGRLIASSLLCVPMRIREAMFGLLLAADKAGSGFGEDDLFLLQFLVSRAALSVENIALYESVLDNLHSTLRSLITAIEAKDRYTQQHSTRVTELSVKIAEEMELSQDEITSLRFSGYLHDIGKIGVPEHILSKAGRLTDEEFELMKAHPVIGEGIVGHLGLLPQEKAIVRHHHERWDGRGYPDGLKGKDIPRLARIITVADAFDAMTSDRPYRKAMSPEEAIRELVKLRFIQFDGQVVDVFIQLLIREPGLAEGINLLEGGQPEAAPVVTPSEGAG